MTNKAIRLRGDRVPTLPRSLPCTTTDWVMLRRGQTRGLGNPRLLSYSRASPAHQWRAWRSGVAVSHAAVASHWRRYALLYTRAKFFRQKAAQGYLRPTVTIATGPLDRRSCCLPPSLSFGSSGGPGNWRVTRLWSGILKCVSLKVSMGYQKFSSCSQSQHPGSWVKFRLIGLLGTLCFGASIQQALSSNRKQCR